MNLAELKQAFLELSPSVRTAFLKSIEQTSQTSSSELEEQRFSPILHLKLELAILLGITALIWIDVLSSVVNEYSKLNCRDISFREAIPIISTEE